VVDRRLGVLAASLVAILGAGAAVETRHAEGARSGACAEPRAGAAYTARVLRALRQGRDVWGEQLLSSPGGPTYARAARYLTPLLLAGTRDKRPLTESGVHYLAFSQPRGTEGAESVALHVADGSQILSQRTDGRGLTLTVDGERYGSCLGRLSTPHLALGWLPILQTRYTDAPGARYAQESFAGRTGPGAPLVSYVRLTVDARRARTAVRARFASRAALTRAVPRGETRTFFVAWAHTLRPGAPRAVDEAAYEAARRSTVAYWERRLEEGTILEVPERRVMDAERNLLVQDLGLTWRYSVGNPYEQFSFPEGPEVAQVMAEYGFGDVAQAILRTSLTRRPKPYPNWKMGSKLLATAVYYRLERDRAYVARVTPILRGYVNALGRQITAGSTGLLGRERYSSDIPDSVYGLHSQAVAWQGLRAMGKVWALTGGRALARRCSALAARLGAGLRRAVLASQTRLPDGSLFIPVRLLDDERPYGSVTETRLGSYWNLVAPYALASGLFPPKGTQATGALRYLLRHGSRLLGLVRAGAYSLYPDPRFPTSGTDEVYGNSVARFLADNDRPDQLVLSLYGQLAAAMTRGTFVTGEAVSVAPLRGAYHRSTYLPPNGAANAAFLTKLRLTLLHEVLDRNGNPRGLELAFATPRAWLGAGRRIAVRDAPTSFGPVSLTIEAAARAVRATVDVPRSPRPRSLVLRLRLPSGKRIAGVVLNGRRFGRFSPSAETIDLSGRSGSLDLVVGTTGGTQ
jgi:hypothetical protein